MKRITTLLLAMALVIGSVGAAQADGIDVKVKGQWEFAMGWASNVGWADSIHADKSARNDDKFLARHRVRTQINFIASEYLQGVVIFEMGDMNWGRPGQGTNTGGQLDADSVNIETKRAYLDWVIPNTEVSVRMGVQGVALPSGPMGSPILNTDIAGIVASSPINDMVSITGFWLRPWDQYGADTAANYLDDEVDAFGVIVPVKGSGWKATPWGVYAFVGGNSGMLNYLYGTVPAGRAAAGDTRWTNSVTERDHTGAWWGGLNFELTMFDPMTFTFDVMYGDLHRVNYGGLTARGLNGGVALPAGDEGIGTRGWFLDATLDFKLDWGTPGLFGWWSSGDSEAGVNAGKFGRMPVISDDDGFKPTHFGGRDAAISTKGMILGSGTGTWGIGAQIANVSFVKDLSHKIKVAYYRGTNDAAVVSDGGFVSTRNTGDLYLTTKDSAFEVNFDHTYKIYENLTAMLELGYIYLTLDKDVWKDHAGGNFNGMTGEHNSKNSAYKAQLLFRYSF